MLRKCGKRVKTKTQKVFGANSYVCRSYRGTTDRVGCFAPLLPILNRVNKESYDGFVALAEGELQKYPI